MQNYSSDEEISSIPEDEYQDYDRQDFEAIQFADTILLTNYFFNFYYYYHIFQNNLYSISYNKQHISEADEDNDDDDQNQNEQVQQKDQKLQRNGIQFRLPQRNQIENKKSQSNLNNQKILAETTNLMKNISKIENRPSTSSSYKPIYTASIHQSQQLQKKYNYKQKSFNTLPKKSDPVARYQQMSQQWKKTKFLQNTNGLKEGRKLNLDIIKVQELNFNQKQCKKLINTRIELQKQELKESGMFHRYQLIIQNYQIFAENNKDSQQKEQLEHKTPPITFQHLSIQSTQKSYNLY